MSTFDPNELDIDFDNLGKPVEHDSVKEKSEPKKPVKKKSDPLDKVEIKVEKKPAKKAVAQKPAVKKQSTSMLADILESDKPDLKSEAPSKDEKTIYDINITSIDDLMERLVWKEYDFVTLEPQETYVEVVFRKDKQVVDTRNIRYSTYTNLLIKIKTLGKISVEDSKNSAEARTELKFKNHWYKIGIKTVPDVTGEKVFFKAVEVSKKLSAAKNKQTSMKTILKFMGIVAFLFLVLGGAFITFIVLNAKTEADVNFFRSLWIEPNDINTFIQQIVTILFAILVFLETVFVVIYGFKFFLTKKTEKRKKIVSWVLATLFLIITFITASAWLFIDDKVKKLPDWWERAKWDVQVYDTDISSSNQYTEDVALLTREELKWLIGPIDLRFNVAVLADKEARNGFKIDKYIWDFWEDSAGQDWIIETLEPEVLYSFDKKQTYEITLTLEWTDLFGKPLTKVVENIPAVEIAYLIGIEEEILDSWGKLLRFDGTSLQQRGTLEWYYGDDFETPASKWYIFRPGTPIFKETTVALYIKNSSKTDNSFDRIFVIKGESDDNISWEILATPDIDNGLLYSFEVTDIALEFGNGFIESFLWNIDGKDFTREGSIENNQKSSQIDYEFKSFGEHEISVVFKDSAGKTKTLRSTIEIEKQLTLATPLQILDGSSDLDSKYNATNGEYFIDALPIPTELSFSARKVTTKDTLYSLQDVSWDFNSDGDIDETWEYVNHEVPVAGNYTVTVNYTFVHRKRETTLTLQEKIYIQAIKKDAILKLDIEKDTEYVPVTVRFDASASSVLAQDIIKFEYDYGDGIVEERDAINEGHIYKTPGDYTVKLTVTTNTGEKHSIERKLILKDRPDIVKITPSLYDAPIWQEIDFSSADSSGQIIGYFWDFGDGNTSTEANPSHAYNSPWEKTVKLMLDFSNNNTKSDELKINILP